MKVKGTTIVDVEINIYEVLQALTEYFDLPRKNERGFWKLLVDEKGVENLIYLEDVSYHGSPEFEITRRIQNKDEIQAYKLVKMLEHAVAIKEGQNPERINDKIVDTLWHQIANSQFNEDTK